MRVSRTQPVGRRQTDARARLRLGEETDARATVRLAQRDPTHQDRSHFAGQRVLVWQRHVFTSSADALRVRIGPSAVVLCG